MHEAMVVGFGRIEKGATHIIIKFAANTTAATTNSKKNCLYLVRIIDYILPALIYYNCRSYTEWGLCREQ